MLHPASPSSPSFSTQQPEGLGKNWKSNQARHSLASTLSSALTSLQTFPGASFPPPLVAPSWLLHPSYPGLLQTCQALRHSGVDWLRAMVTLQEPVDSSSYSSLWARTFLFKEAFPSVLQLHCPLPYSVFCILSFHWLKFGVKCFTVSGYLLVEKGERVISI